MGEEGIEKFNGKNMDITLHRGLPSPLGISRRYSKFQRVAGL